jgi:hypothetical protein
MRYQKTLLIISIILLAAISRFFTPWPNVTPLGAMALIGGSYFSRKWLIFPVPIAALWISNLVLNNIVYSNFYDSFVWFGLDFWAVSLAMILIGVWGYIFLKIRTPGKMLISSVVASILFFLVTNFGVWLQGFMYPMNFTGLSAAFIAALPFFWNTLIGDIAFVFVLFGAAELVLNRRSIFATQ